jgi:hypothetical protein
MGLGVVSAHGVTCAAPACPYYRQPPPDGDKGECRKARPTGFQPDLRRNDYWPMWVQLDGSREWCGEHPAVRAFARQQANEEATDAGA